MYAIAYISHAVGNHESPLRPHGVAGVRAEVNSDRWGDGDAVPPGVR
jgi:hypothetical protein